MAGTKTRAGLIKAIRNKLAAWETLSSTLNGAITTTTATSFTLTSGARLADRMMLVVDSEIIEVVAYSGNNVTDCIRGARGTTAATHLTLAAVKGYPFWSWVDTHITEALDAAVAFLREGGCWTLESHTATWAANTKEFSFPAAAAAAIYPTGDTLKILEVFDDNIGDDGDYKVVKSWKHIGSKVILNTELTEATNVRLWVQTAQPLLAADATVLNDDRFFECLVMYATGRLMEEMMANRVRYFEYSASLNDRASTPDELQRDCYYFFNQATILRDGISRPGLSGQASMRTS